MDQSVAIESIHSLLVAIPFTGVTIWVCVKCAKEFLAKKKCDCGGDTHRVNWTQK